MLMYPNTHTSNAVDSFNTSKAALLPPTLTDLQFSRFSHNLTLRHGRDETSFFRLFCAS